MGRNSLLQEARQGRLKGRYQPLGAQLVVPAEYETAIAAALGEYLDAVVVEGGTNPEDALLMLSRADKGRAVLLPVDWTRTPQALDAPQDNGCMGVASQLVKGPDNLNNIVCMLLGQVLIARDRAAARQLASSLPETARVVTLQGEVFHGSGIVVAGPENRAGTIGRPRRIQEMQAALVDAEGQVKEIQQRLRDTEAEANRKRTQESELDKAARQAAQGFNQAKTRRTSGRYWRWNRCTSGTNSRRASWPGWTGRSSTQSRSCARNGWRSRRTARRSPG